MSIYKVIVTQSFSICNLVEAEDEESAGRTALSTLVTGDMSPTNITLEVDNLSSPAISHLDLD